MKMFKSFLQTITIVILTLLSLQSCKKSDSSAPQSNSLLITEQGTPTGVISNGSIGASGGSLQSADGNLIVTIPSGALSSTAAISIQPISNKAPLSLGSGYRLLPEGTTFTKPVQLTFQYNEQLLKGALEDFLWIVTQASDGSWNAMLKSVVDKNAKTVTIETTHFSDWALGKFIDFTLNPSAYSIKKGQSVQLKLSGFSRDKALSNDDELAPLTPVSELGDGLTPLTPIPPVESRLMDFRVKQWTLNGAAVPVSNSSGSLNASGYSATYTAPNKRPTVNPVAVTVQLEADNKEGGKVSYLVTSNITVIESELYLLVKIDGKTLEYYQYGFNGEVPADLNNASLGNCAAGDDGVVTIYGSSVVNGSSVSDGFSISIDKPLEGTRTLKSYTQDGNEEMTYMHAPGKGYEIDYTERVYDAAHDICNTNTKWGNSSVTILTYEGSGGIIHGTFTGDIYEDKPDYGRDCKTPDMHKVEGEFNLIQIN